MTEPLIVRNGDSYDLDNLDTREWLEADILAHYKTPEEKLLTVRKWLDRQVAITKRECRDALNEYPEKQYAEVDSDGNVIDCDFGFALAAKHEALARERSEHAERIAELTATCDALREQREHWFDEAVTIYRRFYPHDKYSIPSNIAEMVLAKVDELQATNKPNSQFDVLKTAENAENATSKDEIRDFDDSREELEADVASILRNAASHTSINTSIGDMLRYTVPGSGAAPWQLEEDACEALASIAERQIAELTAERDKWASNAETGFKRIKELEAERDQLDRDLTAEHALVSQFEYDNEQLREAIDAMNNGQFYAMYKAKCDECEQLKKVVRTQADSFKKLEIELAGKQ